MENRRHHYFHSEQELLLFLADCTLATVDEMAGLKSRKRGEYQRQINIAAGLTKLLLEAKVNCEGNRAKEVNENFGGNVALWAVRYSKEEPEKTEPSTNKTFRRLADAAVYYTDCTLATVSHMAMLKSKNKSEYARQINIAQDCVDYLKSVFEDVDCSKSRIQEIVMQFDGDVEKWASQYLPK